MNRPTRTLVSFAVAGTAVAALMATSSNRAQAFPPFKDKEGKNCVYCHTSPTGGKRNYRGLYYKAHNLTFAGFDDAAEAKKAGVEIGPDPEPKPKSWTAPEGAAAAPTASAAAPAGAAAAPAAEKKITLAEAKAKVKAAEAAYKKNPKNAAAKKAYAAALADQGHVMMLDQSIPPVKRYPEALSLARQALALDPTNKTAAADKKAIEDAYKSMGKPVPAEKKK